MFFLILPDSCYLKNSFVRGPLAQACPLWAKILGVALAVTLVVGGAVFAGVYFGLQGQYFDFIFHSIGKIDFKISPFLSSTRI
jgi:hypothetical protein